MVYVYTIVYHVFSLVYNTLRYVQQKYLTVIGNSEQISCLGLFYMRFGVGYQELKRYKYGIQKYTINTSWFGYEYSEWFNVTLVSCCIE